MEVKITIGEPKTVRGSVGLKTQVPGEPLTVTNVMLASDIVESDIR